MNKVGGKIILWFLILAMMGFTATRTMHFLQLTFPPDEQYVSYLALAALDLGVLGWLYYASHSAEGVNQRTVAYGMIFVCASGVVVTTIADMLMVSSKNGVTTALPPQTATGALWAVMIVITLNFFAGILVHLVDPKHQRHMAQERARDKIHGATLANIEKEAERIAPEIAAQVARHWAETTVVEMAGLLPPSRNGEVNSLAYTPSSKKKGKVVDA